MARPPKQGLDYFPFNTDFFHNKKIKKLKAEYGADGIAIYMYLLCEIYKNGYYIIADEDFIDSMADELKMNTNKINLVLKFLLGRSLFDNTLFQSDTVLTSISVQRRYQFAVQERINDHTVEIKDFWLLEKTDTETLGQVHPFLKNAEEKSAKESKENKSKLNESVLERREKKTLTPEEKKLLAKEYGIDVTEDYIKRTTQYHCCNYDTIRKWIAEDKEKERSRKPKKNSFNDIPQHDYDFKELEKKLLKRE